MTDTPPELTSSRLFNDPRIKQGKHLLMEAVRAYQQAPIGIRPPHKSLSQNYHETIEDFQKVRGGKLYFPYLGSGWGKGPLVELLDGSIKYDMICGIGPHFWGHSYPPLIEASIEAALSDTIMQGHLQQNQDAIHLSKLLISASGLDHCFLSSSGAMANENALKLAFHRTTPATRILAFDKCFIGRSITLSQITDKPAYRVGVPITLPVDYIPYFNPEDPQNSIKQSVQTLRHHLARYPNQHAAMCFELVQGEAGFKVATADFFITLMDVLKEYSIPIFVDEVQTFGRTPSLFAFQYYGLQDYVDVVTIGKLSQVCATLYKSHMKPKPGLLSQTFTSSTSALQTSCWIIQHLLSEELYGPNGKIAKLHQSFEEHFKRLESRYEGIIRGPYGIGAMLAFTPLDGEAHTVYKFVQDLFQAGVIAFVAGSHPMRVRFLIPAGIMTFDDVDAVMKILESVLSQQG